jgi:hypothetical protein
MWPQWESVRTGRRWNGNPAKLSDSSECFSSEMPHSLLRGASFHVARSGGN